jgi:endonuclease V-like protein UPF0215 family
VKAGVRALGVAESYRDDRERADRRSTLAGAVVRADRVVDGFVFDSCTVGGTDATAAVGRLADRLDRPDVRYLLVSGIAPAWFNVLDIRALADRLDRPVLSVSFEASEGLTDAIQAAFDGPAASRRLALYRAQPTRRPVTVGDGRLFVRSAGVSADRADRVVRAFTPEGNRPEPVRVARLAARAADRLRRPAGE